MNTAPRSNWQPGRDLAAGGFPKGIPKERSKEIEMRKRPESKWTPQRAVPTEQA